ncbi:YHS domain-containing (seleno)protein [Parasphingopyxis sp.]|uniref:YHS domain-containing (seleno)protein n=1 Tax=Parasphingopyxis sp. TaxID=1920299 RepID=UPI00262A1BF6|nr:YHS domain-containing (seleno)protein [Parasphingopyxis sp.]
MRTIALALAAAALIPAACSAPETVTEEVAQDELLAEVNDDASGPVYLSSGRNIGLSGYDAVSYQVGDGTPQQGNEEFAVSYNGVQYHFANAENAETFQADPVRYAPAYGGFCAWAAARGDLAAGNPENYRVVDGRLYLNFNGLIQSRWEQDIEGFIESADENYPQFAADATEGDSLS